MKKLLSAIALTVCASASWAQSERLAISNLQIAQSGAGLAITGTAENQSDKPIKNAFIKFNLYDPSGALVGNTITHASNLEGHGKWSFRAATATSFTTAKVSEINVYD